MSGGYAVVLGPCLVCHQLFSFNPEHVPSFNGEPICEPCITEVNKARVEKGRPPFKIYADAYEPIEAGAL